MRLLEIVRGKRASRDGDRHLMELAKKLGKVGVLVGNCRGFVGNRMFGPYRREAQFLVEEGASVEAVDQALYDFGMAMGPLAVGDLAGLDVGWRIRKEYTHLEKPGRSAADRRGSSVRDGTLRPEDRRRLVSLRREPPRRCPTPKSQQLVKQWVDRSRHSRNARSRNEEIVDRRIYALVNEGARILEEGYALRAVDIDIVYIIRLRLPGLSRRPDVVRRHGRPQEGLRPHLRVRTAARRTVDRPRRC